ncbi:MAG: glycosyltransferase family 9 protein [Verrucomicrobia bacterium]|jgi:ADP-heptose:LPS heptosyltransferase|nr:glycosyltransferase family 9 protein [Verrucomicrobiota bacterium]
MKKSRVLVVYSGWLGDMIWLVPTIHALKTVFDSISLVVSEVQAPLARIMKNGLLDEVYVDDPSRRLASAKAVRQAARANAIDTFIDFKGRWKTGIYIPWGRDLDIRLPHRRDAREYALSRLVHPRAVSMPARSEEGHMVDAYLSGLSGLVTQPVPVSFNLPFDAETMREGERIAKEEGLREKKSIALNLGSAQYSKIWPIENVVRLSEILEQDMGCKVVLMGARGFAPNDDYDARMSREFFANSSVTNLIEKTTLAVDAYLLSCGALSVSVGNDSFAGHMAGSANEVRSDTAGAVQAANGRWYRANHTVALFSSTNPLFCQPYDPTGTFSTIVLPGSYPDECVYDHKAHTCPHYGDRYCVERAHCMQHLTVDQVVEAIEAKLKATPSPSHRKS